MKKILLFSTLLLIIHVTAYAQVDFGKIGKTVENTLSKGTTPSNEEVIAGLKEALTIGGDKASTTASAVNGYYKNPKIKIPFPPEAKSMEKKLRSMGMKKQVDKFILTMNRAAEEAARKSAPIFANAIRGMNITDGVNILKGADTAATGYLRQKTSVPLHQEFKPVVKEAVQKVDVTKYWKPLVSAYNKIPMVEKMNPDLDEYITNQALQGLFYLVSQEEIKIRKDPAARVTDLLKKVFGK